MIIEADKRLSKSIIWQIQRKYFESVGQQAWQDDVVPHEISCNPYMAQSYGRVILGYLRDCLAARSSEDFKWELDQPVYVVELGAGSARLTHYLIHYLLPKLQESPFDQLQLKFVLTDFVPATIDFWQQQPKWKQWVAEGLLDFANFDAINPTALTLLNSGITLEPAQLRNPLILLANYFFDSIPQDNFVIKDGQLCENLLTLLSDQDEPDLNDPAFWRRVRFAYEAIPLQNNPYNDEQYNQILFDYEAILPDTSLSFPNMGIDCMQYWRQFGDGRQLWLTSDLGYSLPDALINQPDPMPNLHGSFSMMVNYHAFTQFVLLNDGEAFIPDYYQDNLQVLSYCLGSLPNSLSETARAFDDAIAQNGPNDYFAIRNVFSESYFNRSLSELLSFVRYNGYDIHIFREVQPALLLQLPHAKSSWFRDVCLVMVNVWQRHLPLGNEDRVDALMTPLLELMELQVDIAALAEQMSEEEE